MTATPDSPRRPGPLARLIFAVPVIGWMLREVAEGDDVALLTFVLTLIGVAGVALLTFGLAGLAVLMVGYAAAALAVILWVTFG